MRIELRLACIALLVGCAACGHSRDASAVDSGNAPDASPRAPVPGVFGLCAEGAKDTPFAVGTGNPFAVTGCAAGDAAVFQVGCISPTAPTAVGVTSDGWPITQVSSIIGSSDSEMWVASFGTIVPAAEEAWFSLAWEGAVCASTWAVGDDLRGADTSSGLAIFDAHVEMIGSGNVTTTITTAHASDIVWFAGASTQGVAGWEPGYGFGMMNESGDVSFYKYTTDPANTSEPVGGFTGDASKTTVVTAVSVRTP